MTDSQQTITMIFGVVLAIAGVILLFLREEGKSKLILKLFGQHVEISTPALAVLLCGCIIFVMPFFLSQMREKERTVYKGPPPPTADDALFKEETKQRVLQCSEKEKEQKQPDDIKNGVLVKISEGAFWRGCYEETDKDCDSDERPARKVFLDTYYIDKYEVTVAQYRRCVNEGQCTKPSTEGKCNWGKEGRGDYPINCVNWEQASKYCQWAGKRLPTEAEWEKAARGDDGQIYPWGNSWDIRRANVEDSVRDTTPVGKYPPGEHCLYDMAGNVWEWVQDYFDPNYYEHDGEALRNPQGPESGSRKVMRGGSMVAFRRNARTSFRHGVRPDFDEDTRGFRCALGVK